MMSRATRAADRRQAAREHALIDVLRQMEAQIQYLKARLLEAGVRLRALDNQTPTLPPWPKVSVPRDLVGSMDDEV